MKKVKYTTKHILFIGKHKSKCEVVQLQKYLRGRLTYRLLNSLLQFNLVDNWYGSLSLFFQRNYIFRQRPSRIVVFGYRADKETPALITIAHDKFIASNWFDTANSPMLGVFFVRGGDQLFDESPESWTNRFNDWVSFKNNYDFLLDQNSLKKESRAIYKKIFIAIYKGNSAGEIEESIKGIFKKSIFRIQEISTCPAQDRFTLTQKILFNMSNLTSGKRESNEKSK